MASWLGVLRRLFGGSPRQRHDEDHKLLPSASTHSSPNRRRQKSCRRVIHASTLRRLLFIIARGFVLLSIALLWFSIPPSYQDIRKFERRLPQHNLSLPFPEGQNGTYLRFPGHLWGLGLNNVLQEAILISYIAYLANRSYVFEDYTWSHTPFPYTIDNFALRPARVPLNAFISGPTAGGPMSAPRAVSAEFWEKACPPAKRYILSSDTAPNNAEGDVLIDWWVKRLKAVESGCVEIDASSNAVFIRFVFAGFRILSIWQSFSTSPIIADFVWSPLVQSAVIRNFALLQPLSPTSFLDSSSNSTLTGLVAVHLRRGDYKEHCQYLAGRQKLYMGLNRFPALPDQFDPKPYINGPHAALEAYYSEHCLPSVEQIVARLHALRVENPSLRRVYVLTNGWGWWLNGLKGALQKDGWDDLTSSLDIVLDHEQKYVAMAVDMAIAEKAEIFVGNGFSSLTSNIVMLRMAKGLTISTNRFL